MPKDTFYDLLADKIEEYILMRASEWEQMGIIAVLKKASRDVENDADSYEEISKAHIAKFMRDSKEEHKPITSDHLYILNILFKLAELNAYLRASAETQRKIITKERIDFKQLDVV